MWLKSEFIVIVGVIVLALMVGYDKWKRRDTMYKKKKGGKKK